MAKFTDLVDVPDDINEGLTSAGPSFMIAKFGHASDSYGTDCGPVTNSKLKAMMVTEHVGPFRVTGLNRAVESLKQVLADIKAELPELYAKLGTAGMLCVRLIRGSGKNPSNHSWGTTLDLTISDELDERGDDQTQSGLILVAKIFNRHKWYWGASFRVEDAMHFECSKELIESWNL